MTAKTVSLKFVAPPFFCFIFLAVLYYRTRLHELRPVLIYPVTTDGSLAIDEDQIITSPYSHIVRPNGILEVNPNGPHPLSHLIADSEAKWEGKLARASKTLDEAVAEYVRRYKRNPPPGFDLWWDYVVEHGVQLPDEYDQISEDLEPFWGMEPSWLGSLEAEQEKSEGLYTISKNDSGLKVALVFGKDATDLDEKDLPRGAADILTLLQDVQQHLPNFRAVFSHLDNPDLTTDYGVKQALINAAASQTHLNADDLPPPEDLGWISACAASSPARQFANQSGSTPTPSKGKSFIYNHRLSMDPCLHPELLKLHGEFLWDTRGPKPQATMTPRFSYCASTLHHNIRIPALLSWVDDISPRSDDPEWDQKLDERLSWRGSNTGSWHAPETPWRQTQRSRLVDFSNELNGNVTVLVPPPSKQDRLHGGLILPRAKVNPALMDVAFAGKPLQCAPEFCEELSTLFEWRKYQSQKEAGNFKYILDVDGNAWSSRFKRLMTSNSLVFKATVYPEWFADRVQPWVHYVPVQVDYSDLYDTLAFFRGGLYGEGARVDLARKIAEAGRRWSKTFWRKEDMTAYLYRLFLEYARVMNPERVAMS